MVFLVLDKQFGSLVIATRDTDIVLGIWLVEVSQAPVDHSEVTLIMVDHDIERFDVAVHDAVRVGVIERLEDLVDVDADVHVVEAADELLCLDVRDVFEHEAWSLRALLANNVVHSYDVGASVQVLEDLGFTIDFFSPHGLQDFDNAFLVIGKTTSLVHFGIFAASQLLHDLVLGEVSPLDIVLCIVGVVLGALGTDPFVRAIKAAALNDRRNLRLTGCAHGCSFLCKKIVFYFFHYFLNSILNTISGTYKLNRYFTGFWGFGVLGFWG